MSLKPIISFKTTTYQVSGPCYYALHNGTKVIRRGYLSNGKLENSLRIIAADTEAEVDAEIGHLKITPLPLTPRQAAAAYFNAQSNEIKAKYGLAFQGLSALNSVEEVIRGVEAIVVDEADAPIKATILNKLRGQ